MKTFLKHLYYKFVPELRRKQIHKYLHLSEYEYARTAVFESSKGNFSLRGFDQKKSIFVHIPKAAGTSIALSIFGELPYHYKAIDYIVIFGRETFNEYFKFAFVRNPWDRVYSAYSFLQKGGWDEKDKAWAEKNIARFKSFNDFALNWLTTENVHSYMHFIPQYEFICDRHKRIIVDYLGYFETINEDFNEICRRITCNSSLAHTNKSTELNYTKFYTEETKELVAQIYKTDIELFGYSFNGIKEKTTIRK
ncbi:MAG: hypothetical protein GC149_17385 [Gammaproteobacteria bacterium]|nr:hypothetical protein [Gammaproteobacteria bacterium]